MKSASSPLLAHFAGEVLTTATCWKVTRTDGEIFGYTDHNADLVVSGITYKAATGHTASGVESTADLSVDNLEVGSFLDDSSITELDLIAGVWNHATVEIFRVNYLALGDGALSVRKGHLGEIRVRGPGFVGELRGLAQALQQTIGDVYTPSCRANLFDARCAPGGVLAGGGTEASFTVAGTVTSVTSPAVFLDTARTEALGWFNGGKLVWTSGLNVDLPMEVKQWTLASKTFELMLPMSRAIQVGDGYSVTAGCNKRFATDCVLKFANPVNFRGEPHVPGLDAIVRRP